MDKLSIMRIASELTVAAMSARGNSASPIPIDPTNQEAQQRGLNLETWEIFRAFYAAVEGALADDVNWLPPAGGKPAVPPAILSTLAQPAIAALIASNPTFAPLVSLLKGLVDLPAPAPVTPLPNPGTVPTSPTK